MMLFVDYGRVAILTFHLALFSKPQHPVVILTVASLLYHQTWEESIKFTRQNAQAIQMYVPEILEALDYLSDDEIADRVTQFAQQVEKSVDVLTDMNCLREAMTRFPDFPSSGLVFIPQKKRQQVKVIFQNLAKDITSIEAKRRSSEIYYRLLTEGDVEEIRFVLGKIILGTLVRGTERGVTNMKNNDTRVVNPSWRLEAFQQIRHRKIESMDKNENNKRISPLNYEDNRSSKSATKTRSFEDNCVVTEHRLSGKLVSRSSNLRSSNSSIDKILEDEHVKDDETYSNMSLLSGLFR
ncbi:hypothetical protein CDL12_28375 [Handroanthus impetiginosus]|uniref:Uncharacterized protein n=1 Tax=Handroanthus impetiginosus TaxID=429701 RepID=A0A2G9G1E7_9LAMI|nr:hypothetical protein CDL12_28375 [Handroanthus impetiginosus]